jgi:hypothetical protein
MKTKYNLHTWKRVEKMKDVCTVCGLQRIFLSWGVEHLTKENIKVNKVPECEDKKLNNNNNENI